MYCLLDTHFMTIGLQTPFVIVCVSVCMSVSPHTFIYVVWKQIEDIQKWNIINS